MYRTAFGFQRGMISTRSSGKRSTTAPWSASAAQAVDLRRRAFENVARKAETNIAIAELGRDPDQEPRLRGPTRREGRGILIINPPYGERMDEARTSMRLPDDRRHAEEELDRYDAWVITPNLEAAKFIS